VTYIIAFLVLAALSYLGVYLVRRLALRHQILDTPNERSSHSTPIPLGGGLAIALIVLATGAWVANEMDWRRSLIYIVSASIMAWMGWRDDVRSLPAVFRLVVQGLIAIVSIWGMGYFKVAAIPLFGDMQLGFVGILITFLWIVGLTNAYNFMDGIDGMAGGVAFSAALGWMWLAADTEKWFVFWVALAIAASSLGFLGHNWTPAKVFMGDVGSTFLGYTFAVLSLVSADRGGDALLIGTLLMWIVIMDSFVTFLGRVFKRENVFTGHRSHLFQRLVLGGYKHTTISQLYMLLTVIAGLLAYLWSQDDTVAPLLIFFGLPSLWILLSMHATRLQSAK
jgi:UDP-N-acetylmuramyl pentapeptide phosphotransferase/UDP-N-acetylglucosamine-1-phosphate transferase